MIFAPYFVTTNIFSKRRDAEVIMVALAKGVRRSIVDICWGSRSDRGSHVISDPARSFPTPPTLKSPRHALRG